MAKKELLEVALDSAEVLIDQYIKNDVVKEIPVLGTALKVVKAAADIRDRMFAAKIGKFLSALDSVPDKQKDNLRAKLKSEPEEVNRVGEVILFTLDRLSDLNKPEIISKIFLAYVDGYLKGSDFRRIVETIDIAFIDDLNKFFSIHNPPKKSQEPYLRYLSRTGLTEVVAGKNISEAGELYYELSKLGTKALNAYRHGSKIIS